MKHQKTRNFSVVCGSLVGSVVALVLLAPVLVGCGASNNKIDESRFSALAVSDVNKSSSTNPQAPTTTGKSVVVAAALGAAAADEARGACRPGMVSIEGKYCIDRYEASLVEAVGTDEKSFSPYQTVSDGAHVRAVSEPHVVPQGYISRNQAEKACGASGKRLCGVSEWQQACRGPENKKYGYSNTREVGRCNDNGANPVLTLYGPRYDATTMNQPQINQFEGGLSKTGDHKSCSNGYGVYDMVGNLHEWVADPNGTFYGGYYQDVASLGHGEGCGYLTTAHSAAYHDYSTGFRCCADIQGGETSVTVSPAAAPPSSKPATIAKPQTKRAKPTRRK